MEKNNRNSKSNHRHLKIIRRDLTLLFVWAYFCKYIMNDVIPFCLKALWVVVLIRWVLG